MQSTLMIDGGLGRVICSIPALERFVEKNPDTIIITYFWTSILWGNKLLAPRVFDNNTKGMLDRIRHSRITKPEPYYNNDYINQKINLIDAFNQEINGNNDHMPIPKIYLSRAELENGKKVRKNKTRKVIGLQPFGSTGNITEEGCTDNTARSMNRITIQTLVRRLRQENYDIYLLVDKNIPFLNKDDFLDHYPNQIRDIAATIANCDYFIGIDSSGQHIARCFNIPGTVLIGGTSTINISYPDFFNIIEAPGEKSYMSYRLCEFDYWLAEIENSSCMDYDKDQAKKITDNILNHIKKTT